MVVVCAEVAEGCVELGRELYHRVRLVDEMVGWEGPTWSRHVWSWVNMSAMTDAVLKYMRFSRPRINRRVGKESVSDEAVGMHDKRWRVETVGNPPSFFYLHAAGCRSIPIQPLD